jgi:hypothetical protein
MKKMLKLSLIISCVLVPGTIAEAQSVQIGYTNSQAVTGYSQSLMNEIGQLKWYFAHASVGGNMMNGIYDLRTMNSSFYQLQSVSEDGTPPASTQTGAIYEHNRGNPGWQAKFDQFQICVSNGWRFPLVNLAMNKLCYIDPAANLNYYLNSMTGLEAAYPETVFVYVTIPLTTATDNDNYLRSLFNDGVRDWVRTNNRVLFDIADMEAHDTNGVRCTFTYNSRVCERLCDAYTSDGGHLNSAGAQLVARGYYALGAALLAADRDHDGISDGHELLAGTCPTDGGSVFRFTAVTGAAPSGLVMQWASASNRLYTLQRGSDPAVAASFTNLVLDAAATPPINNYTDAPSANGPGFYRVRVRQ